jgi:hypothetical protein
VDERGDAAGAAIGANGSCLVCGQPARLSDWGELPTWLVVDGCRCGGFRVWKPIWEVRLALLQEGERQELGARLRAVRAHGAEAWLTTADRRLHGPLVISAERPAPP